MSDALMAVFAVVVSLALFVVGGWFFFRKPGDEQPDQPVEHTVERTWTAKTMNVAIAWFGRALGPGRPEHQGGDQGDDEQLQPIDLVLVEQVRPQAPPRPAEPARPALAPPPALEVEVVDRPKPTMGRPELEGEVKPAEVVERPRPDWNLIDLEGVDMSQAPIVPANDGTSMQLPTVPQLQEALATGGFERFMTWLRAFFRASGVLEADARNVHEDAMHVAARARNKYVLALQAFQAVQSDGLDSRTVTRMWEALAQAEQEASAAALATHATAQTVTACGGGQPTVAAVISALDYGHGDVARSVRSAPVRIVRKFSFYEN
ncbi:hypothetical protein SAMN05421874_128135 [Nonomuraea maritima]|uniref:Uncharacterized protein n=1 Tax=Nonomuraea maritima TaxID=683260 RepID=A0A1G9MQM2_9ACTN|nr:hypothetical protein [Nonomuraea maritima]SDL76321.1 hypothetical protein SAMN05421874_128135 [Nonomuraea maritima]